MRHLLVPAYSATAGSYGDKYCSNRTRSHSLIAAGQSAQQRYTQDYVEMTFGYSLWNSQCITDSGDSFQSCRRHKPSARPIKFDA